MNEREAQFTHSHYNPEDRVNGCPACEYRAGHPALPEREAAIKVATEIVDQITKWTGVGTYDVSELADFILQGMGRAMAQVERELQNLRAQRYENMSEFRFRGKTAEELTELIHGAEAAELRDRPLKKLARYLLGSQCPEAGDVDGASIEAWLIECGLYAPEKVTKPCSEEEGGCQCVDYGFPTTCNKLTKLALEVRAESILGSETPAK